MLYVLPERPIDDVILTLLRHVDEVMTDLKSPYFIAGATARDVLLTHVFGLPVYRATVDVDIAVAVENWDGLEDVKSALQTKGFVRDSALTHRLHSGDYPVDIIPFGGVEDSEKIIAWPPDLSTVMNVAGYQEAFDAAETVRVHSGFELRVLSLAGLAVLKIFAWADRGYETSKDAQDLDMVLRDYSDAGNEDRLYGEEIDVLEAADFRLDFAGALLLGRDARRLMTEDTRQRLTRLLDNPTRRDRLELAMAVAWSHSDDAVQRAGRLLEQFRRGLG